jgi:hypothetical protein
MISKYATGSRHAFEDGSIDVLYEFYEGHPRKSLMCCEYATEIAGQSEDLITPRHMTQACLKLQNRT